MHKLAQSVRAYIGDHDLLRAGDRVGVAVSGGADSLALLRLMLELRDDLGVVISVVHLNHKLRAAESDGDEQFVRDLARSHGLEFKGEVCDIKALAAEKKLSLEAAARSARYDFFRRAVQDGLLRIATAHTLDDQAETVLLKLFRGAGTRGWAGIFPRVHVEAHSSAVSGSSEGQEPNSSRAAIVRPLLGTRRFQLREYLTAVGQKWREDATNQDLRHMRNRIRHEILPCVEREVNPSVCNVLAEAAEIARSEEEYWATEVNRLLPEVWRRGEGAGRLNAQLLSTHPVALRRRLVRASAESLALTLEFTHVEKILGLGRSGERVVLPQQWTAERHGDEIQFSQSREEARTDYRYALAVPGRAVVPEAGIEVEARLCRAEDHKYKPEHLISAEFSAEFAQHGLFVRNWRAGERFWPAHTKQPRKIKELLQDRNVTGSRKKLWPVVVSGDEIVWLRGFGVRRDFQASGAEGILIREVEPGPK